MINVEEFLTAIEQLHGYKDNGKKYIFYYDETNNYRKVKITEKGLNDFKVMFDNFTLGGIGFEKFKEIDSKELIVNLKLQTGQELKSKTFFKGKNTFKDCIEHKKLNIILNWILNNAYVHYSDIDSIYFSVIDIVDSVCSNPIAKYFPQDLIDAFKDELYWTIRSNFEFFLDICKKTDYPNVTHEKIKIFCKGLIDIINKEQEKYTTLELLKDLIEQFINYKGLTFLKDNEERIIMESFYSLRQQRCIIFRDSMHIFDKELVDEQKMNDEYMILNDGNKLENYKFIDSKNEVNIQISDIIIYLIAKYLKFVTYYTNENVENTLKSLNKIGRENLTMLIQIMNKSNEENTFFLETINSQRINFRRNLMNQHIKNILSI
ncbi:MAG: DUF3800 domain-containing protein [Clostridia bacterium]